MARLRCAKITVLSASHMDVRLLRPPDLAGLLPLRASAALAELTVHTWPKVDPDTARVPFPSLLFGSLMPRPGGSRTWIARQDRATAGHVKAAPRAGGLAWDVLCLTAAPGRETAASALLEEAASHAGSHGARRVFVEAVADARAYEFARDARLERYTSSTLYRLAAPFNVERTDQFEARPRLRADEPALFQLYGAAVPAQVRAAEAMTIEEWAGLHRGSRRWQPALGGSRQQYVWELGETLVGWMGVQFGQRSQCLELLVHPRYDDATDRLLRYALQQVSHKAPVYLPVRDYQPALASSAERLGFTSVGRSDLYVKLLAARVTQPMLVPANVVGA